MEAVHVVPPSPERYVPLAVVTRTGLSGTAWEVGPMLIELTRSPEESPWVIGCHSPSVGLRR